MNGPQINDNAYLANLGLQIEKAFNLEIGDINLSSSISGARYFYEVDDEPALAQTSTARDLLGHEGNGVLFKVEAKYRRGMNRLNLSISHLRANDERQNNNYQRSDVEMKLSHLFTKKTKCSINLAMTEHQYSPTVLDHDDVFFSSGVSCSHRF